MGGCDVTEENSGGVDRRTILSSLGLAAMAVAANAPGAIAQEQARAVDGAPPVTGEATVTWVSTTRDKPWQVMPGRLPLINLTSVTDLHVMVQADRIFQTVEGFGGCIHERGWQALSAMPAVDRDTVLDELFTPGKGANLRICRIPIGANDYALDWYSHNENADDFAMAKFSIARDHRLIIPFIRAARQRCPDLSLWASPWSPPTWMKTNSHYATAKPRMGLPDNGIRDDQVREEGQDTFIQDDRYFRAYGLYFRRFVDEYRKLGLPIGMVMPQNEFNSAQVFPSCTWTPAGLARFIPHLAEALQGSGTDIFFGTLERADADLFEKVYADPKVRPLIKGVGAQWAGRGAIPFIHHAHPELKIYQSEQECGNGLNDWRFARFTWQMMKDFMRAGASVYDYWNIAADRNGFSTWGWAQNSMISVDAAGNHRFNPDYHVFKHLSHFVQPGAKRIGTISYAGYENLLAFSNPDGRIVIVAQNDMTETMPLHLTLGTKTLRALLPADSFNSFVI